jgi:hypothetical protein
VGSRRREYGCGNRWQSDVMASHGRDTDDDGVQRSKELTVMGRKTRKAQGATLYARDSNKRSVAKKLRSILGVLPCSILKVRRL